MSRLNG